MREEFKEEVKRIAAARVGQQRENENSDSGKAKERSEQMTE